MKSLDIRPKKSAPRRFFAPPAPVSEVLARAARQKKPAKLPELGAFAVPRPLWRRWVAVSVAGVVLVATLMVLFVLPQVEVAIAVRSEPTTRDFEIRVDQKLDRVDAAELAVPGRLLDQEVPGSKAFPATGARNVGQTASGFVYIYNFTKTTLILRKDTTVLTANGRQYLFTQDVSNIRPTALLGLTEQEVDPSSLIPPVPVVAAAPGEQHNMPSGARLEITNEVLGAQPEVLYAVVADGIAGGTTKEIKIASQTDLLQALGTVRQETIEGAKQVLFAENPGLKLFGGAMSAEIIEQSTSVQPGAEVSVFEAAVRLRLLALVFNEGEIRSLIQSRIERLLPYNKKLKDPEDSRLQMDLVNVNLTDGQAVILAHYEGEIVYQLDEEEIRDRLKGKNIEEIREILLSRPEVQAAEVRFSPFWVKKAPKFGKNIYLEFTTELSEESQD